MEERLQKILSRYGIASRRKAEQMILERRVRVNGNTASLGDTAVDGEDVIEVDGVRLKKEPERLVLMLNKPRGYVTTLSDEQGRKTAAELVADAGVRVYPIGRLDRNSEGLLLFTNDGDLAQRLTHPKQGIAKTYLLWVSHYIPGCEKTLSAPIEISGRMTQPAEVRRISLRDDLAQFAITIREGRNRQIRRLCEAAGITVTRLCRVQVGGLRLGELPVGKWRRLSEDEIEAIMRE